MAYTKNVVSGIRGAAQAEAAGLRWLAEATEQGGARIAQVLSVEEARLELEQLDAAPATEEAAQAFGAALARTHRSLPEDALFGQLPAEHPDGVAPLFGPAEQLLEMGDGTHLSWGAFHAQERLDPLLDRVTADGARASSADLKLLQQARDRIASGELDDGETPSRIHGDLWTGNVLWTAEGAVLIDPAAHAGHREADLAMLDLFGLDHLEEVMEAYDEAAPLRPGWAERTPMHQLFPLLAHWVLFGGAYESPTLSAAETVLDL